MGDEHQDTLKGKIKILFQLGKWQDVGKLCAQYAEKYGKDVDIDTIRFKSERRLRESTPEKENPPRAAAPDSRPLKDTGLSKSGQPQDDEDAPLLLIDDHDGVQNPAMLVLDDISAVDRQQAGLEELDYEPFPQANELIITEPFSESELMFKSSVNEPPSEDNEPKIVDLSAEYETELSLDYNESPLASNNLIPSGAAAEQETLPPQTGHEADADRGGMIMSDSFYEDEPVFSLPGNQPSLVLDAGEKAENAQVQPQASAEDLAIMEDPPLGFEDIKSAFELNGKPMVFDAEPTLTSEPKTKVVDGKIEAKIPKPPVEAKLREADVRIQPVADWPEVSDLARDEKDRGKPGAADGTANIYLGQPKASKKFELNLKTLMLIVLPLVAAAGIWLILSGKLGSGGGTAEEVSPAPAPAPRRPQAQRTSPKVVPPAPAAQTDESEKLVSEKISRAEMFYKKGDLLNALAVILEAKKIKTTEPLLKLEEMITSRIRDNESREAEQKQAVQDQAQSEEQSYAQASAENTIPAWENFMAKYPQGRFVARARNKIVALEKADVQRAEQEFQLKIGRVQKLKLRSGYVSLSQAEVDAVWQQLKNQAVQFESLERGGEKVIVDLNSGLMWILWKKPMVFDKAKWWANRIYAGYSGWRLPTVDESLALLRIDPALYGGLKDFAVWTGDGASDHVRSVWVLRLPQGRHVAQDYDQLCYVWAVRKAGR